MSYCVNNEYLAHHGIQGQKWGVRHGPPYPLGPGDYSKAEVKAVKAERAKGNDIYTKSHYAKATGGTPDQTNYKVNKDSNKSKETKEPRDHSKLKTAAKIGLGVGAAAAVGYGAYVLYSRKQYLNYIKDEENTFRLNSAMEWGPSSMQNLGMVPKLTGSNNTYNNVKLVNPGFKGYEFDNDPRSNNCALCSVALAMREKGFDVVADQTANGVITQHFLPKWFDGAKEVKVRDFKGNKANGQEGAANAIFHAIEQQPEGSYGVLGVTWNVGGGHAMFYKVINGAAVIFDGQDGAVYDKKDFARDITPHLDSTTFMHSITNLTNCQPTDQVLQAIQKSKGKAS